MDDKLIEKAADEMAENSWIRQQCFIADIEECIEAAKALGKCRSIVDYYPFVQSCNNTTKRIIALCNDFDKDLVKIRENAFYKVKGGINSNDRKSRRIRKRNIRDLP